MNRLLTSFKIPRKLNEIWRVPVCVLGEVHNDKSTQSHGRHSKLSDELCDSMDEQRLETWLNITEQESRTYGNKTTMRYILNLMSQSHMECLI